MNRLRFFEILNIVLLSITAIVLIGLQIKPVGWILLLLGISTLFLCRKEFAKHLLLIYISLSLLGLTRITTDVSYRPMIEMGITLGLAIVLPFLISRYIYKDNIVRFIFHHGRSWYRTEIMYVFVTFIVSYFLIPFYLANTGAYLNWNVESGANFITRLFIGTNALGIWDELFFVSIVLGILRKYIPFVWANLAQAVLFTSFLFELGFTGWGPFMIFIFALLQGYIFKKTESLFYVITIHLVLDLVLFLALINAHHPTWTTIFLI